MAISLLVGHSRPREYTSSAHIYTAYESPCTAIDIYARFEGGSRAICLDALLVPVERFKACQLAVRESDGTKYQELRRRQRPL